MRSFLLPLYQFRFLRLGLLLGFSFLFLMNPYDILAQSGNYKIEKLQNEPLFLYKADKDGTIRCELAKQEEIQQYILSQPKVFNYTIVKSLNPESVRGMKILLRATDQLLENKEALLAFRRAATRWERFIRNNITVVIDVDYGETRWGAAWPTNVLGSTNSAVYSVDGGTVSDIIGNLKTLHAGDNQLQDLYDAIPIPTPTTADANLGMLVGGIINLQALGYVQAEIDPDLQVTPFGTIPTIGFNSAFSYDFDPSDGITEGIDFDAVVVHEIGHALGFTAIAGNYPAYGPPNNYFYPWDLFRVRPDAVEEGSLTGFSTAPRVVTPGPVATEVWAFENNVTYYKATQVSFDGLKKLEVSTATLSGTGGDDQQAPHWRDDQDRLPSLGEERFIGVMDPTAGASREEVTDNDLRLLEIIGYDIQYVQEYAMIQVVADGNTIDLDKSTDTLYVGDASLNATIEYEFDVMNLDLDNALNYQSEIEINFAYPDTGAADILLETPEGTIAAGTSSTFKLIAGNSSVGASFFGILRLYTNVEDKGVIEIPFEFSVDGLVAPTVALSESDLGDFEFNSEQGTDPITKSFDISNDGTVDLEYRLVPSLSSRSNVPFNGLAKHSGSSSVLSKFLRPSLLKSADVIYQNNFETGWGGFTASGERAEDWQIVTSGAATLDGHSKPTSAYFGYPDSLKYRNDADAVITSPGFDFSSIPPEDQVVLTFNHYLKAEEGYDFASVLMSLDNGKTFEEIATSNNGIFEDTDTWESVMIELPNLSGNPDTVYFAFRFTSDTYVEEEGWYIDDIEITAVEGANTVYTIPRSGVLSGASDPEEVLVTVAGNKLSVGYYQGNILVISNDPRNPSKGIPFKVNNFLIENAQVNRLYGSTGRGVGSQGRVISIDLNTGAGTEIGSSGFEPLKSITINPADNALFAFAKTVADSTAKFVRVNASDGFGLYLFELGLDFTAIVFDTDGTLYLTTSDKKLYELDPVTGATTFVANIGINVGALAINNTGELWAGVDESSENDRIYKIDKVTGVTTRVGRTGLNKKTKALVFGPEDILYGTTGEENLFSALIQIDRTTGAGTQIGLTGFRGILGLAFKYDSTAVSVESQKPTVPDQFELSQNYPNPFNPSTTISFAIPENSNVKLSVYNLLGEEITTLLNGDLSAGYHSVDWNSLKNGKLISSGIYFYSINATGASGNKFISAKKMILLK